MNVIGTEMSYRLLPQFLLGVLGAGPMAFGLIEGAAETVSSFGALNWLTGVAAFPASLMAGCLWRHYSPSASLFISALLSFAAAILLLLV
jgi:hypothetical protein